MRQINTHVAYYILNPLDKSIENLADFIDFSPFSLMESRIGHFMVNFT